MKIPNVSVIFGNGNLLQGIAVEGVAGLVGTGQQPENKGKVFIFNSLAEAESQGITALNEPWAHRHVREFYEELGSNGTLYMLLLDSTVEMAGMLSATANDKAAKLVQAAAGRIAYLGVFRTPQPGYAAGADYFDADVAAAILAAKTFVQAQNAKLRFLRVLVEGRINNESSSVIYAPNSATNGFAGVVTGGTLGDKSASVGLALGRKMKYGAHIKLGKVANGPLSATDIYVGTKKLNDENSLVIPAVAETKATATITITAIGADGDAIWAYANLGGAWTYLGQYNKVAGDVTTAAVATAFAAAINAGTAQHGYTAAAAASVITLTAKAGTGDKLNASMPEVFQTGTIAFTKTVWTGGVAARAEQKFSAEVLHERGHISFLTYPGKAGFYFGIDSMASDDDYRILAHGAVIDEVARICAAVYINELEGEVEIEPDGKIASLALAYLKDILTAQVETVMAGKISGFQVIIDPEQDVVATSKLKIKARVQPLGYTTYIEVDLGFTRTIQ